MSGAVSQADAAAWHLLIAAIKAMMLSMTATTTGLPAVP